MSILIKQSLSEQIYEHLRKDIILQKIPCGTKLTIKELEIQFNVSSTPVREALTRLAQEGLIDFSTNLGAKVKEYGLQDLKEIIEICHLFDTFALKKAMTSDNYDLLLKDLEKALNDHKNILNTEEEIGEWYYNNYFHTAFYSYIDNERIRENAISYRAQFSMVVVKSSYNDSLDDSLKEHTEIYNAVKAKDTDKAVSLLSSHFIRGQKRLEKMYNK